MATPDKLYVMFRGKIEKKYHDELEVVVQIFCATGSPTIIDQLTLVCQAANRGCLLLVDVISQLDVK